MEMASSSNKKLDDDPLHVISPEAVSALREDLKYMQATNVNVSTFVSVKLSGHSNYQIWKAQMLCLIESQMLRDVIDAKFRLSGDKSTVDKIKQYDNLVKGWILGSMKEVLLENFIDLNSAQKVWKKLESLFNQPPRDREGSSSVFTFRTKSVRDVPEIENTDSIRHKRLYEAAVEGCWWKAKSILKIHKNAATEAITENGNTILHLAVEMGHDYFVEKLLEFLKDGKDIETKNYNGRTALHIAATVGNKYAAQLLVKKRKDLLVIQDFNKHSPLDISYSNMKLDMYTYLVKSALSSNLSPFPDTDQEDAINAICAAIYTKEYDLGGTLLKKYPEAARTYDHILMTIALTFPTSLSFMESIIYPSFSNVIVTRGEIYHLFFNVNFMDKCVDDISRIVRICNNTCCSWLGNYFMILVVPIATLYPIYQLFRLLFVVLRSTFSVLYFLQWKVLAVTFPPIKTIEQKKKEHKEAKEILSLICDQMGTTNDCYRRPILEAVRQGAYEVVDEILFRSPDTLNYKNDEGHNIIQLAIINRAEKVYNLIHHIIEHTGDYRSMLDSSVNNLVHLAGRLAPSFVLDRTNGAALQLQRELLWCQEVEKLMLPMELIEENIYKETPAMVFTREHKYLLKEGEIWMKTTAESCSITAALIVTIVFAAAITVPGGSNQESGVPVFKKEIAFAIFAVSNAFSLFTAATSLLLFLSILTARFSEKDFRVILPRRLIFGLLTLFLSTTAMIVAFGAILFLVFCDQRPWMLAPISGFACLPISVIVTIKLPLLVDLIQSAYFPIFGNQSYLVSCKTNRKNTVFIE